ncbi:MAG: fibronectin type III-like domain-contianing protein, partial [Pirellulales bacterium]|nr:fibronectin type III-like domain-contianing protein [Pirellulales bacterium]
PFGFGLSYTTFKYGDFKIENPQAALDGQVSFSFTVTNTGRRAGKEVAQVYFRDEFSSVTTPVKRLIRFQKVALNPGQSKQLQFTINCEELSLWNKQMQKVVEPGEFTLMAGPNAGNTPLRGRFVVE